MKRLGIALVVSCGFLSACSQEEQAVEAPQPKSVTAPDVAVTTEHAQVNEKRIAKMEQDEPGAWLTFGRNYEEQRFSPLQQVNRENVDKLGIALFKDFKFNRTATPFCEPFSVADNTLWWLISPVR